MSRHASSVQAVLATPDGPVLVDPPEGSGDAGDSGRGSDAVAQVTGVLARGVSAGSAAASSLAEPRRARGRPPAARPRVRRCRPWGPRLRRAHRRRRTH